MAEHHLAAAVSEAGGLGIIGAANAPADWVRNEIRKTRERTDKPFGVNIMLLSPYAAEVAQAAAEEGVKVISFARTDHEEEEEAAEGETPAGGPEQA